MKTVAAVHTASPMIESTKALFAEHLPNVRLFNITDDSLIHDVIRDGAVTDNTARRLTGYYAAAVNAGADVIFNTCSSVGEIADAAAKQVPVPIVKIDEAMCSEAAAKADRIGVLATLPTTLGPTVRLVQRQARRINKDIQIIEGLAEGAFAAVIAGDAAQHDALILDTAKGIANEVDLIVLAQGSMARMEETLAQETGKSVLSSPVRGVLAVKAQLAQMT